MYDSVDRSIEVTNRDRNRREEPEVYVMPEDYDGYLHERDLYVLDDHLKGKMNRGFFEIFTNG